MAYKYTNEDLEVEAILCCEIAQNAFETWKLQNATLSPIFKAERTFNRRDLETTSPNYTPEDQKPKPLIEIETAKDTPDPDRYTPMTPSEDWVNPYIIAATPTKQGLTPTHSEIQDDLKVLKQICDVLGMDDIPEEYKSEPSKVLQMLRKIAERSF